MGAGRSARAQLPLRRPRQLCALTDERGSRHGTLITAIPVTLTAPLAASITTTLTLSLTAVISQAVHHLNGCVDHCNL